MRRAASATPLGAVTPTVTVPSTVPVVDGLTPCSVARSRSAPSCMPAAELAQARLREGLSRAPPFRLTRWDNGTLSLDDVASGRRINLEAFGLGNAAAFARLLEQGRGAS